MDICYNTKGSWGKKRFYINDGICIFDGNWSNPQVTSLTLPTIRIGKSAENGSHADMIMDQLEVWSTALTQSQIASEMTTPQTQQGAKQI